MLFAIIGIGLICYALFYGLLLVLIDCDLQLAFYDKFGKSISSMQGMVVFITGASSGIGEHTALALAKHGVKLVLTARRKVELERVKDLCIVSSGGKLGNNDVFTIAMDVLNYESHESCFKLAVEHFGHVDVLLNNAGRSQRALWEDIESVVEKEMFELNVFSVINLTKIAIKYFKTRGHGHVAVTSSIAGIVGIPYSASYTGSKHAIHGYFDCLRTEKIQSNLDLTVSVICPGPVFSNFLQESFTDKSGIKYGVPVESKDRRMTGERCGQLIATTLANKLTETWVGLFPIIPFTYASVYFPIFTNILIRIVGPKKLFMHRDSKEITFTEVQII